LKRTSEAGQFAGEIVERWLELTAEGATAIGEEEVAGSAANHSPYDRRSYTLVCHACLLAAGWSPANAC